MNEFVLVRGLRDTRGALARWNANPWPVVREWALGALAVGCLLLLAVWIVALLAPADFTPLGIPGITSEADPGDMAPILWRNSLVLALHATACVAGFIAGRSLAPHNQSHAARGSGRANTTAHRTGLSRWVHEKARPIALGWVVAVTVFSLATQAYALGLTADQLANQLAISPGVLVLTVLPHAIPELVALFLPLAAWTIASRRNQWHDLLAATFATVAVATPILVVSAVWEVYAWPRLLEAASPMV